MHNTTASPVNLLRLGATCLLAVLPLSPALAAEGDAAPKPAAVAKPAAAAVRKTPIDSVIELVKAIGTGLTEQLAHLSRGSAGLGAFLDAHLAVLADQEALYSALLQEMSVLPASARAYVMAMQSGVSARLGHALQADIDSGAARPLDTVAVTNIWIALTNHYLLNRDLFAPGESVIARHGQMLKSQLLTIVGREGAHD